MKRFSVFSLMVVLIAGCENGATNPELPSTVAVRSIQNLTSAVGAGLLLATTNQGELVEIDVDLGTADLVGDALGELRWTGLSFDPLGNLFVSSRRRIGTPDPLCKSASGTEGRCAHLYKVNPITGAEEEVGNTGIAFLSDIDFASDGTLYGNFFERTVDGGALATFDLSTDAKATLVGGGFGSGPGTRDLENGGLSVHPQTGELWGVESSNSPAPSIFRVDPETGLAFDVVRLGLGHPLNRTPFGLDALEILPDGRFIALRGRWEDFSTALYEINPTSVGGLAELTELDLSISKEILGRLNGLESRLTPVQVVAANIRGIVAEKPQLADKLEDVIANLETAFAERFKTPPDNQAALGKIEGAVGDLGAAVNDGWGEGAQLMNELAGIARQMAVDAIDQVGDPTAITDAEQLLAERDGLRKSGAFKDAVAKYKDALAKAEIA